MDVYQAKLKKLPGSSYGEVRRQALNIFTAIKRKTKRKPYIRSAYFNKQKVFLDFFWNHLFQKVPSERFKRLKYFGAAIELIRSSRKQPTTKPDPNKPTILLHRFTGITKEGEKFYVQIKEDTRSGHRYFISCFPDKKFRR